MFLENKIFIIILLNKLLKFNLITSNNVNNLKNVLIKLLEIINYDFI
jgi:hypothetical protein